MEEDTEARGGDGRLIRVWRRGGIGVEVGCLDLAVIVSASKRLGTATGVIVTCFFRFIGVIFSFFVNNFGLWVSQRIVRSSLDFFLQCGTWVSRCKTLGRQCWQAQGGVLEASASGAALATRPTNIIDYRDVKKLTTV